MSSFAVLLAVDSLSWITRSQANWGVGLGAIKAQMRGDPDLPGDIRAELGSLWSYNPHDPSTPEGQRGLGGGITWAWDDALCDRLLDRFNEDIMFDTGARSMNHEALPLLRGASVCLELDNPTCPSFRTLVRS